VRAGLDDDHAGAEHEIDRAPRAVLDRRR
jgi:hypothetical protein